MTGPEELSKEPLPSLPPGFVQRFGLWLHRALRRLSDAVVPAHFAVFEKSIGVGSTQLLAAAARHGIADLLEEGPRNAGWLAERTGLQADPLHRVLRALATDGVFRLLPDGRFENTRLSRALFRSTPEQLSEWCQYFGSVSNVNAWSALESVLRSGRSGFRQVHGMSVWEWFEQHPDQGELFAHAMMGVTVAQAPSVAELYPFDEVQTVCDVGGGRGTLISELLVRHPHLRGMLLDAPGVLASAQRLLERRGVAERVQRIAGNFFERIPAGADVYTFKNVLHDWDDDRCVELLRICRKALTAGQKVLIIETVTEHTQTEGIGPLSDVQMMVVCEEGRERGEADYARLLDAAGFRLARRFHTPVVSVLEGVATP